MDALSVNDRVGTCKINVFKDTRGHILAVRKTIGFKTVAVHNNHLTRQNIAHKLCAIDIKGAGFRGQNPSAVRCPANAKRAKPLRVAPHRLSLSSVMMERQKAPRTTLTASRIRSSTDGFCERAIRWTNTSVSIVV